MKEVGKWEAIEAQRQTEADEKKNRDATANGSGKVIPMSSNDETENDGVPLTKTNTDNVEGGETELVDSNKKQKSEEKTPRYSELPSDDITSAAFHAEP